MFKIIKESSFITTPIWPIEFSYAIFYSIMIVAFVFWAIRSDFGSFALLIILEPFSWIGRSIYLLKKTKSMGHIIFSVSFIDISICVDKTTRAICWIL
jgi:hypothetical protein